MIFFRPCDPNRQTDVKKKFSLEHPGESNKYSLVATQNLTHQKEKKMGGCQQAREAVWRLIQQLYREKLLHEKVKGTITKHNVCRL